MGANDGGAPRVLRASTPARFLVLWSVVAPYVRSADLWAVCLVSQHWNHVFAPYLWGDPGSRFGTNNDDVCSSLTKFKRGLRRTRYEIRSLTHTLHIPPATPELVEGPQSGWLRECLDRLPFLQSISVSGVAFFDHESLRTVRRSSTGGWERRKSNEPLEPPVTYGLRLLAACFCQNTTSASLTSSLVHFPNLIYLDLSSATGVRNPSVLRQITCLEQLQILRLQNCGLRDVDMEHLRFSDMNILRSLDLRNNYLTEAGVATALSGLTIAIQFLKPARREPWHVTKAGDFENLVKEHLIKGFAHEAFLDDHQPLGLSHLYVAGNDLSIEGLSHILGSQDLRVFDCGSLMEWQTTNGFRSPTSPTRLQIPPSPTVLDLSVFSQAFQNLTYLRIHHSIITEHTFSRDGLVVNQTFTELDAAVPIHELDSTEIDSIVPEPPPGVIELEDTSGLVELMGDLPPQPESHGDSVFLADSQSRHSNHIITSDIEPTAPLVIHKQKLNENIRPIVVIPGLITNHPSISSDNIVSPSTPQEVFHFGSTSQSADNHIIVSPSTPTGDFQIEIKSQLNNTHLQLNNALNDARQDQSFGPQPTSLPREPSNEELIEDIASRRRSIRSKERKPNTLLPSMLPNLRTLILTDVPVKSRSQRVVNALIHFIQECAEEEALAQLEATRQRPEIQLLERHDGHATLKDPLKTFRLERLVLEMSAYLVPDTPPLTPSRRCHSFSGSTHRNSFTKSSTEDADSETFMSATETDFTFFGDDDCSLLVTEGRLDARVGHFPTAEKILAPGLGSHLRLPGAEASIVDVVGEVARFRKSAKAAHEAHIKYGGSRVDGALLGYWSGDITVVRLQHSGGYGE